MRTIRNEIQNNSRKKIHILATGGTIAGKGKNAADLTDYKAGELTVDELIASVPNLPDFAEITAENFCQIASEDMTTDIWLNLAKRVNAILQNTDIDGFVITHGTDTMAETAYFLNLTCPSSKPVVLTGAMLPATAENPDGTQNLADAVALAACGDATDNNVMVVMNGSFFAADSVRKIHSSALWAFADPCRGRLGCIEKGGVYFEQVIPQNTVFFDIEAAEKLPSVDILTAYADLPPQLPQALLNMGRRNIIFDCFGNGTLPKPVVDLLNSAEGIFISTTQTGGGLAVRTYPNVIKGLGLTAKQARIVLMLLLAENSAKGKVTEQKQIAEIIKKLSDALQP